MCCDRYPHMCPAPSMHVGTIRLTCSSCKTVFDGEVVENAPVAVFTASLEAIRCPVCGSGNCGLGGNHGDAPAPGDPIEARVYWWKNRGEHGISSCTIFYAFTGAVLSPIVGRSLRQAADVPHDPDDFRRCRLLLDLFPEWRADLAPLVHTFPWYGPLVEHWDEMDRLWDEESPSGRCQKLYDLMKELEEQSRAIRYGGR